MEIKTVYALIRDTGDGEGCIDLCDSEELALYLSSKFRTEKLKEYEYYLSGGNYTTINTIGLKEYELMKESDLCEDDLVWFQEYKLINK